MKVNVKKIYLKYASEYKLSNNDKNKLWNIIKPIALHKEFIKRCSDPFFHHDIKSLGEHILCDTILTYKLVKKLNNRKMKAIDLNIALYIAMFHDLYESPWQNLKYKKKLCNKHGFVHPIEAVINAITWFPEYFEDNNKAMIIIDGVVHHMFPFPVRSFDEYNMELNNYKKYKVLDIKYKDMIKLATRSAKFSHYSLRKSIFIEGRIVSKADKLVAFKKDISSIYSFLWIVGVKNKNINKKNQ